VSTPVGEQPRRDGAGGRGAARDVPGGSRHDDRGGPREAVTVEQLLARQGSAVGRRRAARREEAPPERFAEDPQPAVRQPGLPPVPGGSRGAARQPGLPPVPGGPVPRGPVPRGPVPPGPVPGGSAPASQAGLPPVPAPAPVPVLEPVSWEPESRPSRRSGPIPPLPGLAPSSGSTKQPVDGRRRHPARRERPPASPGRRRLGRVLIALAAVLGVVVLYHLGLYFYVDQKIDRVEALATDGPEVLAPGLQAGVENYVVVGTGIPGQKGAASVATLLASVASDGSRAVLVSFPPTALVDTPECRTPGGTLRSPVTEAFASSLLDGGPSCTVRAVQQLSGLRIDHYLQVDLHRLPGMVDALGGVPVCVIPSAATDAAAHPLPGGPSTLTGPAATGFLRPGDTGSDVTGSAVAERAQRLLTSTLRAAMSRDTIADPVTLTRFLNRAADALTVDEQTTLGDLRALAGSLGALSGDAVQRAALPVQQVGYVPAGTDQAYVLLDRAGTRALFDAMIEGNPVPPELTTGGGDPAADSSADVPAPAPAESAAAASAEVPTVPPSSVSLDVLNGTGTTGLAGTVADLLRGQGFTVGSVGNAPGTVNQTVVRYGPNTLGQAHTVAAAVPGSVLQSSDSIGDTVQLVIGPGYSTVVPVQVSAPPAGDAAQDAGATTPAPEAAVSC
jgi:LCP family protein required for cell wall assembly